MSFSDVKNNCRYTSSGKKDIDINLDKKKLIFKASLCGLIHDVSHCAYGHTVDRLLGGYLTNSGRSPRNEVIPFDKRMFGRLVEVHLKHLIEPYFDIDEIIQIDIGRLALV